MLSIGWSLYFDFIWQCCCPVITVFHIWKTKLKFNSELKWEITLSVVYRWPLFGRTMLEWLSTCLTCVGYSWTSISLTSQLSLQHLPGIGFHLAVGERGEWRRGDNISLPYAGDICSRNVYQKRVQKLAQETWMQILTQVHHSFLHKNNSPPNHVAQFVSCASQFLWWNRAVFNCVQETCTRKKLVPDWLTHVQVSGTRRLVQVFGTSF